jgi:hypothetical protein
MTQNSSTNTRSHNIGVNILRVTDEPTFISIVEHLQAHPHSPGFKLGYDNRGMVSKGR